MRATRRATTDETIDERNTMTRRPTRSLRLLAALGAAALLTGCTTGDDDPDGGPSSPTPAVATTEASQTVYGECVDGVATILADDLDGRFELGDCSTVSVVGVDGDIVLGQVERLVLEGDRNTVVVAEVAHVAFGGNGNVVEHGGAEPEVVDDGDENRIAPTD